jgi:hypothetical protein
MSTKAHYRTLVRGITVVRFTPIADMLSVGIDGADFVDLVGQQGGWRCPLLAEADIFVAARACAVAGQGFLDVFGSFRAGCLTLVGELEVDLV